jgi:hypothetical protein
MFLPATALVSYHYRMVMYGIPAIPSFSGMSFQGLVREVMLLLWGGI